MPTEFGLAAVTCSSPCSVDNYTVTITLDNSQLAGKKSVSFTLYGVVNALSFAPPSSNITLKSVVNQYFAYSEVASLNNFKDMTNSLPSNLILIANKTFYSNFQLGGQNQLSLELNISNSSADYYILTLSPQFNTTSPTCVPSDSTFVCSYDSNKKIVVVGKKDANSLVPSALSLQIAQFNNPIAFASSPLVSSLIGYSASRFIVNQYNGSLLNWQPNCSFPCQSCLAPSACLSCYQDPTISNFSQYYAAKQQCLAACLLGQMSLAGGVCIDCTNNCMQCSLGTSNCTACNSSTEFAYFYQNSCLKASQCPLYFYPSTTYQCLACQPPCLTCTAPNVCLGCTNGTFKYGHSCINSCPADFTVENLINRTCDPCSSICATCQSTVDNCTSCGPNTVWYEDSCQQNCTDRLYILETSCV